MIEPKVIHRQVLCRLFRKRCHGVKVHRISESTQQANIYDFHTRVPDFA